MHHGVSIIENYNLPSQGYEVLLGNHRLLDEFKNRGNVGIN